MSRPSDASLWRNPGALWAVIDEGTVQESEHLPKPTAGKNRSLFAPLDGARVKGYEIPPQDRNDNGWGRAFLDKTASEQGVFV